MKLRWTISFSVFAGNALFWLFEWNWAIGFEKMRHDGFLWLAMIAFFVLSIGHIVRDVLIDDTSKGQSEISLDSVISIGASVLLAVSILVSLAQFGNEAPLFDHGGFYLSTLLAFLWIVLGVFALSGFINLQDHQEDILGFMLKRAIRATFFQALCWAAVAGITLFYILRRSAGF